MTSLEQFRDDSRPLHMCAKGFFEIPHFEEVEEQPEHIHEFAFADSAEIKGLQQEICEKLERFGFTGFVDLYSESGARVKFYGGIGVTYNPSYSIPLISPLHQVLGAPRINLADFFSEDRGWQIYRKMLEAHQERDFLYAYLNDPGAVDLSQFRDLSDAEREYLTEFSAKGRFRPFRLRNSYSDSWGFRKLTEPARDGRIGRLIAQIPMSIVRSRIAVLKTQLAESPADLEKLWHRDEDPLLESRLVIPVISHDRVFLEVRTPHGLKRVNLREGNAYSWNTKLVHRVISESPSTPTVNLVLGFSPWIDIDAESSALKRSVRFGKKLSTSYHDGSVFPFLSHRAVF